MLKSKYAGNGDRLGLESVHERVNRDMRQTRGTTGDAGSRKSQHQGLLEPPLETHGLQVLVRGSALAP